MTKKELAEKVAKEQNLDVNKLMRLTVAELEKMDKVVSDEAEIEEDTEETEEEFDRYLERTYEEATGEPMPKPGYNQEEANVVEQASSDVEGRRLLGYHPMTGEAVYL